jgi:chitodextrinase
MSPPDPRHQISFYWGHNGNNPLSRYRVELSLDSAFSSSSVVASTDLASGQISHMFENVNSLAPGDPVLANTEHFVRVQTIQASNGFPLNPPVTGSRFTTPLAPVLSSVDKNISALKIHWTDESGTMKNSPATLYSVIFSTPGGVSVDSVSPTTYSMPAEVGTSALLFPNTTYQIQVTALGAIGSGNSSAIASTIAVTLANLPLLTTGLSDIFQSSITVRWSAPGNPPDTSYKVEISTDNAFPLGATSTKSVTGIFHVFNSLVPNRRYSVRISAVNRQGVWTSTDSQDYDTKPAPPLILAFSKPPFTTTAELTLNWDANGNDGATFYATMRPPSNTWILAGQVTNRTFQGLAPNTPYSFEVQARDKNNGRQKDAVSGATTTYTRAEPAPSFEYGNVTDIDTWDIRIASRANDPSTTEYAFQLIASGTPSISFDQQFLVLSAGKAVPSTITYVNDPAVWRTLANWGLPDPGTGRYVISGDFLPSDKHELWVYVRNGDHFVENPSQKLIEPQSGAPRVELTVRGSTITAAQSWLTPIYVNTSTIPFRASGSSHFNILMSSVLSDSTTFAGANGNNYQNVGQGWNGDQKDTAYCSNETAYVDPTYLGPLQGVCGLGEDLFYLHIVGDKMSLGGNPIGPIYPGNPSFRVYVDLIPPLAGTIDARGAGYSIPDNGGTLGFQTIDFSWPVIDGGNPVSRSPIVGWAYSFALNDNTLDPVQSTATHFVAGPAVPGLSLSSLGSVPSTGTYYFKVIGLDQAGNWQPTPTSFTYNFKEDSLPPAFKGVSLVGAKMPKSDFHYAAVDPSAPIRLVFSEPVNLANAGALDFVQTHNALGQRVNTPVSFAS